MTEQLDRPEPMTYVETALAEFWEYIYPNLEHIPTERKGSIYRYAKRKAMDSVKPSKMICKIV